MNIRCVHLFAKLRKATISLVMSARPHGTSRLSFRIFMKLDIRRIFKFVEKI